MTLRTAALVSIVIALIVASCGGGDEADTRSPEATATVLADSAEASATPHVEEPTATPEETVDGGSGTEGDEGGSEEQLTLEQYFQRFEAVVADLNDLFAALLTQFPQAFEDPAQAPEFFEASAAHLRGGLDQLDDINPPLEVVELHNDFLDAGRNTAKAIEDFADQLADVESVQELQEALEPLDAQLAPVERRFDSACLALEGIAADNGIAVDLDCE